MNDFMKIFGFLIFITILIFSIAFGCFKMYEFFAPRYNAVDNKIFKESQQYNDGMLRDLENLKMDYMNADAAHKDALRAIILHRFSIYPKERMPFELRSFYEDLQSGRIQ